MKTEKRLQSFCSQIADQFGYRIIFEYLIPPETNNFWYSMGGILGICLALEFLTGILLLFKYIPDAGLAFSITKSLINSTGWKTIINFHFFNSYLIFGLLMAHMMRTFISGAYRAGKIGLWFIGVILAGLVFVVYVTGESLHWDEIGFAVPWHISEILQATNLDHIFHYTFSDLLSIPSATSKLVQLYAIHVAIIPVLMALFIMLHFYLVKDKGISLPYWTKPSGQKAPFSKHIKVWFIWAGFILGAVILFSAFTSRDAGLAPQLLPTSQFYGSHKGPGGLGVKPTYPISWTHGMNVFVDEKLGIHPDIWGTAIGMVLMLFALSIVPFVDRGESEPKTMTEVFQWRRRGWAFCAIALFWILFLIGVIQNIVADPG